MGRLAIGGWPAVVIHKYMTEYRYVKNFIRIDVDDRGISMAVTVLIVEDEEKIGRFIELELLHEGYEVLKASNGREGLEKVESGKVDLVVLDVMLPELNGFEVLRRIRKKSDLPVIMLTARDEVMDKVAGLDGGADDYMTKPFAIEELLARIRLALKKRGGIQTVDKTCLSVGELVMDVQRYEVSYAGNKVDLTHREFELLRVLLENKNIVVSRDTLLQRVCGYDYMGETNLIDVYVRYLRSKIDDVYGVRIIQTVRGVGYCIKEQN